MFDPTVLIGPVMTLVGAAACIHTWWRGQLVIRALAWPTTTGTITRSEVVAVSSGNGRHVYKARIEYDYAPGDGLRHGATICVGGELDSSIRGRAEDRCAQYPVGAPVEVHHDPARPDRSCLERTREGAWLGYLVGNAFLVVGLLHMGGVIAFG